MGTHSFIAVGVFFITYIVIMSEKVHQTVMALAGGLLMVILGILSQDQAIAGIDFNTLGLLIGMMVIVSIARASGMFQFIAIWAARFGRGKPVPIFFLMGAIAYLISTLLNNVTTALLLVPVVFVISNNLKLNPRPFLFSSILLINIGGAATLIGDAPNILMGSAARLPFNLFIVNIAPVTLLVAAVTLVLMYARYRHMLVAEPFDQEKIMRFNPTDAITDWPLLIKSIMVLGLVLIGFFSYDLLHIEGATLALSGAALLFMLTLHDPEAHLKEVEWPTIFFFVGLFIMVAGLEQVGLISLVAQWLINLTHGQPWSTSMVVLWGAAFFSAILDNIPLMATMIPLIKEIGALTGIALPPLWWALSLGANIGGNATIIGTSAGVVVKGMTERDGFHIGFWDYIKISLPVTFVAILLCSGYLWVRFFS